MKDQTRDEDLLALDRELKAMAADVPDMPESFRSGWRQAVRSEAEKQPSSSRKAAPSLSRKWISLLSAAAVLVFLFAGTLATRGILSPRLRKNAADTYSTPESLAVNNSMEEDSAAKAPPESPVPETGFPEAAQPVFSGTFCESAEESSADAFEEYMEEAAVPEEDYAFAAGAQPTFPTFFPAMTESAVEITPEPAQAMKASGAAVSREASGSSVLSDSVPQESPAVPETAGELPPPGFGTEFAYFMEDMGAFLLAALPYLLGAGLLLTAFLLLKKKRNK